MFDLDPRAKRLHAAAAQRRADLLRHPLYDGPLHDLDALRCFMEHHVWAVWDFMSLVTRLQRDLTSVGHPWLPCARSTPEVVRFLNEIKTGEEADAFDGAVTSHFDLYVRAMIDVGANPRPVHATMSALRVNPGVDVVALARACGAPEGAARFLERTMRVVERGSTAEVAATFAFGREQLIPDLFRPLVAAHAECAVLDLYLQRHIDIDGDEHGPMSAALVDVACVDDDDWHAAEHASIAAIEARYRLWSDVLSALP